MFVRFESSTPSASGRRPGVFALANGLASDGRLTDDELTWWRTNNDWFDGALTDPGKVDPVVFDRRVHAFTESWFKVGAARVFIDRVEGYLELLDRHGVGWVRRTSIEAPGPVVYEDSMQIVVALDAPRAPLEPRKG